MWALHRPSDPVRLYPSRSEALADALRAGLPDDCAIPNNAPSNVAHTSGATS